MKTRTIVVTPAEVGRPVVSLLKHHLDLSWSQARKLVETNRVRQGPGLCRDPQSRCRKGQKLRVNVGEPKKKLPPEKTGKTRGTTLTGPQPVIRHVDEHIVVVEKPAGLTTMRHA